MRAIEISSRTDKSGRLRIDCKLDHSDSAVRVLILVDEEEPAVEEERLWLGSVSKNPAFAFLADPAEDIYGVHDGAPLDG
ncbi:MAG TPA: hypothetical protein VM285_04180 [Polyangia bacterium]|nr:hypothetical protein [Polyangia bacterium]